MKNNEQKTRVLLVDDEERFRETTARFLRKRNFYVRTAQSGLEAIEEISKDNLDVVILDMKMSGMDGNETLAKIKKIKPDLEVIVLTGHGSLESAFETIKSQAFDYLDKPCSLNVLTEKIMKASGKNEPIRETEPGLRELMTPLSSLISIIDDQTVEDVLRTIIAQRPKEYSDHELLHRPFFLVYYQDKIIGAFALIDLLDEFKPPKSFLYSDRVYNLYAQHLENSNLKGAFTIIARYLLKKPVRTLITGSPPVIDVEASLMEASNRLLLQEAKRLLVMDGDQPVGLISEEDLFLELVEVFGKVLFPDKIDPDRK